MWDSRPRLSARRRRASFSPELANPYNSVAECRVPPMTRLDHPPTLRKFAPALALLAISVFINYIDRGNLSIAASTLKDELHTSASPLASLPPALIWTYTALPLFKSWSAARV